MTREQIHKLPWKAQEYINKLERKLTLTDDVMGDSEQLPSFLYKSDGGLYFKHLEDTDITEQWNEYLKTR